MAVSGQDIVNYLLTFKGTPYAWGGTQPGGFDCSGLMQYGFKHFGIDIPRVTYDQVNEGQAIGMKGLRVGDLVFFDTDPGRSGPDHVGIYMGDGKMFHTPRPGKSAEIADITGGYYMNAFMGGRRVTGVSSVGGSSKDHATEVEARKLTPEELAASYGWAFGFLEGTPGLDKLFDEAVKGSWSPAKFQAELRDTKWFKKTSSTARETQVMKKTDPATWAATLEAATLQVKMLAAEIGAAIPASKLKSIAENVITTGLDENGLRNILGKYVTFTKEGTLKGEAGMHEFTIRQLAAANGVKVSDQAVKNQAQLIVRKLATSQDFESQIREQAKSAFPGYAEQLDAGIDMKDVASSYIQTMADEFEIPDESIDLFDPTIKSALNGVDANGKPTGKNLMDFQTQLRNDPRWIKTGRAQDQLMNVGLKVLGDLGLTGTG